MTIAAPVQAFLDDAYDEALRLLVDLRAYLRDDQAGNRAVLVADERARLMRTLSALTSRVTGLTAWLMLQKAVTAGEIDRLEAARHEAARLDPGSAEALDDTEGLPVAVRGMVDRGKRLIGRIEQLERNLAASPGP
jgi:hypothetical protein